MLLHASNSRYLSVGSIIAAVMLAILSTAAFAQNPSSSDAPPPRRIRDIRVEGARSASTTAIITYSGLRIGDFITADNVTRAIRNLMERRIFSDVKIYADQVIGNEITVVIVVREYPRVSVVSFTGNDELDEKELADLVTIRSGDIVSPYELDRSRAKIREKYATEGYLFTKVTATQAPSKDSGRIDLVFAIDEGAEVSIGEVTFNGNRVIPESELEGAMEDVREKAWYQLWRSSKFDRSKLKGDEARVIDLYRSRGFIEAEIVEDSIWIDPASGKANVNITVAEGTQYYLRSLTITGNTIYSTPVIEKRLNVAIGEPYDQQKLEQNVNQNETQTDLRSLYTDNGYITFNAEVSEHKSAADSIDVVIKVSEGDQASIRYVTIAGNTKTKEKVIRRELFTRPGATFSKAAVIRSLRNLAALNYFNPEKLQPEIAPVDATTVDVTFNVEERPSDTFNASVGISAQGLTGVLGVSFNNFSIAEPFSAGGGQILNFNWEFGSYTNTFSFGITEPWLFDKPLTAGINLFYQTQDYVDYKLRRLGGSGTLGHRLRWPDDYTRVDLATRYLKNEIVGEQATSSYYRNGTELSTTLSISRSSVDNPIFPTVGSRFNFSNTFAGLADAKYTKHELSFDFYSPIAQVTEQNSLVFYLNNEFGIVNDYGPLELIPPSAFYVMGGTAISGANTTQLRGYEDRSIGPIGIDRFPLGKVYAKTTAELRFGIAMNPIPIYALAFAEAGNVWGSVHEVDPFGMKRSAGVGLRVMVPPIGLLGFDYGYGFDRVGGEIPGWKFHFQFGR
jgi:outer membrane protein insertion porin family